jgi:hypothetical protein
VQELRSILVALLAFTLLVLLRVKALEFRAAVSGRSFHFGGSLRMLLRVLGSLAIPGLGQAMRGRTTASFIHLGIFTLALACVGEAAFLLNLFSAMEHAFT